MKLAICKIGANITFSNQNGSAANADILYFLRQLEIDNHDVTIHTAKTRNTKIPNRIGFKEISQTDNFNEYDLVLIFNGSINFFGGAVDHNLLALYKAMNRTDKAPLVWVNTDGALMFKQLWPAIWKREWAKDLKEEDYYIEPEKVKYLTQGKNMLKIDKMLLNNAHKIILPSQIEHYPLYRTILAKHKIYFTPNAMTFDSRPYDLGFGGYTRNSHKKKRIEHYYNDPMHRTLLFGNLRGVIANNADIKPKCSYKEFVNRMKYCRATVIVGDQYYEDNFYTLRMYESLLADNIVYVDERLDTKHLFFRLPAHDFFVNGPKEVRVDLNAYTLWTELRNYLLESYDYFRERAYLESVLTKLMD